MSVKTIDAKLLSKMFLTGAKNLESKKEYINELNVFPVPDGDTGTNMTLTIMSAAKDVNSLDELSMENLCKAISSGSLRGARGNSGVILSQLLRGFTKVVKEYEEIDVAVISAGFDKAVETAYKAVMKPKEGTILTVAKGAAEKANELFENGEEDLDVFFRGVLDYANEVLLKTPEMLPVLKEAGVVDSGGQGLIEVLQGAYDAFCGKEIEFTMEDIDVLVEKIDGIRGATSMAGVYGMFVFLIAYLTYNVRLPSWVISGMIWTLAVFVLYCVGDMNTNRLFTSVTALAMLVYIVNITIISINNFIHS